MTSDEAATAHLRISGRVQGVWYRKSAAEEASRLGLTGWVRNLTDGTVEAVAQGDRETVDGFVAWCHDGPSGAIVGDVQVEWLSDADTLNGFAVRY